MKKQLSLCCIALLSACSQQAETQPAPAASVAVVASAPMASAPVAPVAASPVADSVVADTWAPPAPAQSPKEQAEQLNDLIGQFKDEAAQRIIDQRKKNMQPSQEESVALVQAEIVAIRRDAERLAKLQLADSEVNAARDAQVQLMRLYADSSEEQVQAVMSSASNPALPDPSKLDALEQTQQQAETLLRTVLKKYRIRAK